MPRDDEFAPGWRTWAAIIFAILLLTSLPARCPAQWKTRDVVLATTALTFGLLDYATTMDEIRRCEPYGAEYKCYHGRKECVEGNPLIGCFPSPMKFRLMSAAGFAAELYVGSRLHGWARTAWFAGWTALSFSLARYNISNGARVTVRL